MGILENLIDQVLDEKYRIDRKLGQGGMGAVYLATHLGTGRPVALKVIAPEFMANSEFVERFKREARAAGLLRHPNVVNVTDFGFTNIASRRIAYLVMEYLNGSNLGDLIKKRGPLPLAFVVDIVEQICLAIDEAHKQGIIHRDLKPDNIWLEPTGRGGYNVKVLDFGLAKLRGGSKQLPVGEADVIASATATLPLTGNEVEGLSVATRIQSATAEPEEEKTRMMAAGTTAGDDLRKTEATALTSVGAILGTPLYMSPEQCAGKELDARSDIYALGVVVYQMLTGETPFKGDLYTLMLKHAEMAPPPLAEKRRDIPAAVAALIMEALAKAPADRPVNATAFAIALRTHAEGELPVLRQAEASYRKHFRAFLQISLRVYAPFLLLNGLIMAAVAAAPWQRTGGLLAQSVYTGHWLLIILSLSFANTIHTAACSALIEQLRIAPLSAPPPSSALALLKQRLKALLSTRARLVVSGWRGYIDYSLAVPVVMLEAEAGRAALTRAQKLGAQLRAILLPVQQRELVSVAITIFLTLLVYALHWPLARVLDMQESTRAPLVLLLAMIPALFIILSHAPIAIATVMLYFRARQVAGEKLSEAAEQYELLESHGKLRASRWLSALAIMVVVALGLVAGGAYLLFVPPIGKVTRAQWPAITPLPPDQNAWSEYEIAIRDLGGENRENIVRLMSDTKGLDSYAFGLSELNDLQRNYLDRHADAIAHTLAGTRRPGVQYYDKPVSPFSKTQDTTIMASMSKLVVAQARRVATEGRVREAAELNLAAYRMGTDVGVDPQSCVSSNLVAIHCRNIAAGALYHWLNSERGEVADYLAVAREVAVNDRRMTSPYEVMECEWRAAERGAELLLLTETSFAAADGPIVGIINLRYAPGLAMSVFQRYMSIFPGILEQQRASLEAWDLEGMVMVQERSSKPFIDLRSSLWPTDIVIRSLFVMIVPNSAVIMRNLYTDRANGAALQALAACLAYEKREGQYPSTLEAAFAGTGLAVPVDVATKKPIGYRLEHGKPVIWLAGVDGKDDGGNQAYEQQNQHTPLAGYDLIYRFGQLPDWFKGK